MDITILHHKLFPLVILLYTSKKAATFAGIVNPRHTTFVVLIISSNRSSDKAVLNRASRGSSPTLQVIFFISINRGGFGAGISLVTYPSACTIWWREVHIFCSLRIGALQGVGGYGPTSKCRPQGDTVRLHVTLLKVPLPHKKEGNDKA